LNILSQKLQTMLHQNIQNNILAAHTKKHFFCILYLAGVSWCVWLLKFLSQSHVCINCYGLGTFCHFKIHVTQLKISARLPDEKIKSNKHNFQKSNLPIIEYFTPKTSNDASSKYSKQHFSGQCHKTFSSVFHILLK